MSAVRLSRVARNTTVSVGIVALAVTLGWVVHTTAPVWLLLFTGILLALFLRGIARFLVRHSPLGPGGAFALAALLFFVAMLIMAVYFGPLLVDGLDELVREVPDALRRLSAWLGGYPELARVAPLLPELLPTGPLAAETLSRLAGIFSNVIGIVASGLIILATGIYIGAEPALYRNGLLHLLPPTRRPRAAFALDRAGHVLSWWLLGQIASMSFVGIFTWLGLVLLQVPLAGTLALVAALLTFIPTIGPILSAVPAALVAFAHSPLTAAYVLALYVVVQNIESYLVTPLIQREVVALPPALVLTTQLVFALLFGFLGLLVATPATVAIIVLVKLLYIEDVLGDRVGGE